MAARKATLPMPTAVSATVNSESWPWGGPARLLGAALTGPLATAVAPLLGAPGSEACEVGDVTDAAGVGAEGDAPAVQAARPNARTSRTTSGDGPGRRRIR